MTETRREPREGEDVVIVLPSGKQRTGRLLHWHPWGRADVRIDDEDGPRRSFGEVRCYPRSWVWAWEDAPEPAPVSERMTGSAELREPEAP